MTSDSTASGMQPGVHRPTHITVAGELLTKIAHGTYHEPHAVLGPHLMAPQGKLERDTAPQWATVRVQRPLAKSVTLISPLGRYECQHEHEGIWVTVIHTVAGVAPAYQVETVYDNGAVFTSDDGYRFLPTLGSMDQHLIKEGRHEELWRVLGANLHTYDTEFGAVAGTAFAVWAPTAQAVRVIGDFNGWDGRAHAMRALGSSGVWELFVPGVGAGTAYKFEILSAAGHWLRKADPMAKATEVPPATASIVAASAHEWQDHEWMEQRAQTDPHSGPMSVYELHFGSWRRGLSYRDAADQLAAYVTAMGFTHVEFMPLAEHPYGGSWGYQVTSYYAPTSRFGSPDDLRYLIDVLHQAGIGVLLDWVPAHFPKDSWALAEFDGSHLYEHPDPQLGEHPDWGTLIFNFGRNEVRNFLVANATFWLEEFHIDGLRVDAVASMLYLDYSRDAGAWKPNKHGGRENLEAIAFLQEANATAYRRNPGVIMIAEESTAFPGVTAPTSAGGLGFGLKWNMGWMNDTLRYIAQAPINRKWHHEVLTNTINYAFSEQYLLPLSHDEVVHGKGSIFGKMPGDDWQKFAGVRSLFAYQWAHPGKQLIFMGSEFAQRGEWQEAGSLDWAVAEHPSHQGISRLVTDLNELYLSQPALWERDYTQDGFSWLNHGDADHNTVSLVRYDAHGSKLVVVANFSGTAYEGYRVPMPQAGLWTELLNTDHDRYGGSGVLNTEPVRAQEMSWAGSPYSAEIRLPALSVVFFEAKPE